MFNKKDSRTVYKKFIFLHQIKQIKIVDFGLAGVSTRLNVDAIDMGSLRYMAPEILA